MDRQSGEEDGWRKGPWTAQEDKLLSDHVNLHGEGRWNCVSKLTGLRRSGKSCRLRWVNYLRPDLKRGKITPEEENVIVELHALWGNRWSTIARSLPGRTDNEIKNYWRTHFKKSRPSAKSSTARARFLNIRRQHQQQQLQLQQMDEVRASLMALNNQVMVAQDVRQEMSTYVQQQQQLQGAATAGWSAIAGNGSTTAAAEEDYWCSGSWAWGSLWNWSLQDDGLQYHGPAATARSSSPADFLLSAKRIYRGLMAEPSQE